MASSLYKAQSALKTCEAHDNKELTAFCRTCNIPICTQCVKTEHIHHDWDHITTVAKERRALLPEICRRIKSVDLPKVRQNFDMAATVNKDANTQMIRQRKEALINSIDIIATKQIASSNRRMHLSSKEREKVQKSMRYLEKMTTELDVNVSTFSDFDVLEMEQEMKEQLKVLQSLQINETNEKLVFVPGEVNPEILGAMLGQIHDPSMIKVDLINTFRNTEIDVYVMCSVKECRLWIAKQSNNEFLLLDVEGKIVRKQKLEALNFVIDEDGDNFYTDFDGKVVKILTAKGESRSIRNTAPLHPTCISLKQDKGLIVNLRDNGDNYELTSKSRRLVQIMTPKGEVLRSFEFADDGKTRLFKRPSKTAENKNGDICIVNILSDKSGELVILRPDGRLRCIYRGLGRSHDFDPHDVVCDSDGHLLVASHADRSVHVLAYDGTFIKYLLRDLKSEPCCLSLNEDKLWMACEGGVIHIYSFRSQAVLF